jgi:hypothetical protein
MASVTFGRGRLLAPLLIRRGKIIREGRQRKIREGVGDRRRGVHRGQRIRAVMPADVRSSGERFKQPCGVVSEGKRVERKEGCGGFIGASIGGQLWRQ